VRVPPSAASVLNSKDKESRETAVFPHSYLTSGPIFLSPCFGLCFIPSVLPELWYLCIETDLVNKFIPAGSIADTGAGAFLTPGSGIRNMFFSTSQIPDPKLRELSDNHPGTAALPAYRGRKDTDRYVHQLEKPHQSPQGKLWRSTTGQVQALSNKIRITKERKSAVCPYFEHFDQVLWIQIRWIRSKWLPRSGSVILFLRFNILSY
jgi:hypothetical protein